jgi:hypothetical protein
MCGVTDEIEVYRTSAEAALNTFSEQTGLLGPVKQRFDYLKQRIYYRQLPNLAREATLAAQKIRTLNLPLASVEDPIVLRILEEGSWADDEDMQVVWANLLVNAITEGTPDVHAAFRVVLDQLEPVEARTLNHLADKANFAASPEDQRFTPIQLESQGASGPHLDNLVRVGVLRYTRIMPTTVGSITDTGASVSGATFTDFGWAFVKACREPSPPG